jgi:tetratricopeptide (TPR) repeat protein
VSGRWAAGAVTFALLAGAAGGATPPAKRPTARFDRIAKQAEDARTAGRLDEAAARYLEALALKPGWVEGHWSLATLLYDLDRFADARVHFRKVVAARPRDGVALALQSLCDVRLGDYDAAFAGLQQARALGVPNEQVASVAVFHLALLLNRAGSHDVAFEILRAFAAEENDSPSVIEALGLAVLRRRWMPDEVPAEKKDMVRLAGRGGYHMARGRRTAVGRLALEELVSRFPAEPNVHYAFGSYIAPEEPEAGLAEYRKELARDPEHLPALVQVAAVELKRGNVAESLPAAESAARVAPDVPAAHLVLGRALFESGETGRAVAALERAAALAPESAEVQFALARAYQRAGRAEEAEKARQEFLKLDQANRERAKDPAPGAAMRGEPQDPPRPQERQARP